MGQDYFSRCSRIQSGRLQPLLVYKVFEVFVNSKSSPVPTFLSITYLIIAFLFPNHKQFLLQSLGSPESQGKVETTLSIGHQLKFKQSPQCTTTQTQRRFPTGCSSLRYSRMYSDHGMCPQRVICEYLPNYATCSRSFVLPVAVSSLPSGLLRIWICLL
jgi:hypothetical protein